MKMWNKKDSFLLGKETWERKLRNKKAGEKWLSVWWFFVLTIIGGAIVIGVLIYYNADVNIKEIEADILAERIVRCLTENGYLKQEFLQDNFDIFENCGLKKEVFGKGSNFYFKISAQDTNGNNLRTKDITGGKASFEEECRISGVLKAKHYPKCSYKDEAVLYYDNAVLKKARLTVIAGSNQAIKRVTIV